MNEELDSQLSAMFDDELANEECELLARRLSRDEQLKARWGRYAVIGAAIRAERGVRLNAPLAGRVSAVILAEPELGAAGSPAAGRGGARWWQLAGGSAVAAGVAAMSILWLRTQAPPATLTAQTVPPAAAAAAALVARAAETAAGATESYVLPPSPAVRPVVVPSTQLANYVVAHSVVSSPVARGNLLSAFMTSESGTAAEEPLEEVPVNVQINAQ
jgi:sigma-E factor negative regulatory protein RseA